MNSARIHFYQFFFFILLFSVSVPTFAQNFTIKGVIQNSVNQAGMEQVKVYLRGTAYAASTLDNGRFSIGNIPTGKYILTISYPGFNFYEKTLELDKNMDLGIILLDPSSAEGTSGALQKTIRSTNIIALLNERPNMTGGNTIYGIAPEPTKTIGDNYLDSKWNTANLLLYKNKQVMEGYKVRYNVSTNSFETLRPGAKNIEHLPGARVQNLVWVDSALNVPRFFVNGMELLEDGSPIAGFFEVLVDGELPLMRRTKIVLKESNYNEALMVGNRDHQLLKRDTYYYLEGKNLIEVPKRRKHFYKIFGEDAAIMKEYVEKNELVPKEGEALFKIFTEYNSKFDGFDPIMDKFSLMN